MAHRGCFLRERAFSFSPKNALLQRSHSGSGYVSAINPQRSMFTEGKMWKAESPCGDSHLEPREF